MKPISTKMSKLFKATGIVYDTDGEKIALPTTLTVECEDTEQVADAISDETGWLVETIADIQEI